MTATSSIGSSNDSLAQSMEESDKETTPAEDRERIFRLESAVTWIKQAVVRELNDHICEFTII